MSNFTLYKKELIAQLLETEAIHTGSWHRIDTSHSPAHATYELTDVTVSLKVPAKLSRLQDELKPDLPWADDHFLERIGGIPLNPPPSHTIWPHGQFNGRHLTEGRFSHTYPERYWPRHAGIVTCHESYTGSGYDDMEPVDQYGQTDSGRQVCEGRFGIRYQYGDLNDMIRLLKRERLTRQAYLPVWFPEDTGVVENQRVPCTLGYHFLVRNNQLSCRYYMRSCDIYRHFTNDVYLTARLMQYIAGELCEDIYKVPVRVGQLVMYITSLHAFVGDRDKLEAMIYEL